MAEEKRPKRLCSEIQLFELCSMDTCTCKDGRYCTNSDMLAKFEAISEDDEKDRGRYDSGEGEDFEDSEYDEYDNDRYDVYDNELEDEDGDEDEHEQ